MRRAVAAVDVDAVAADVAALRAVAVARADLAAELQTAQAAADLDKLRAAVTARAMGGAA